MRRRTQAPGAREEFFRRPKAASDPHRLPIGVDPTAPTEALAPNVRAPSKELLDLALIPVGLVGAAPYRCEPHVLGQLEHRLPGGVVVAEARCLEEAVVHPASEPQLVEDLVGGPGAEPSHPPGH